MQTLKANPVHQEHLLRQERLVVNCSIVANVVPEDKGQTNDVPSLLILRTEDQTAAADAVETGIAWTAPVDNSAGNSVFGLLLNLALNEADKVYSVSVTEVTALAGSLTVTGPGGASSFLTADGNVAIEVAGTALNLSTESPTFLVVVEYREQR
jgi:hypothetical protein